jgi:CRISPR-associated protein Cmr6
MKTNNRDAARGSHLIIKHQVRNREGIWQTKAFGLGDNPEIWTSTYDKWLEAMQYETDAQAERNNQTSTYEKWLHKMRSRWANRIIPNANQSLKAEIFAPHTCAVYAVPGPDANPIDENNFEWLETNAEKTRGEGMHLIYETTPPRNYKRNPDIGGNAANGNAYCSWASIKRINIPSQEIETDCQEIVCLFMGGISPQADHIRADFLRDLNNEIEGKVHLFGVSP